MTEIAAIVEQSSAIARKVAQLQALFRSPQLVDFFKAYPEKVRAILSQTQGQRSRRLVLHGLKAALNSEVLPPDEDLHVPSDWLDVGDIVLPWNIAWIDPPRMVVAEMPEGYLWRYLGEDESIQRRPNHWPFMNAMGLERVTPSGETLEEQIDEIYGIQETEIKTLDAQLEYFGNRKFLEA